MVKRKKDWKGYFAKLARYSNRQYGYKVQLFDKRLGEVDGCGDLLADAAYFDEKLIRISKAHNDENKVYYLLHELGHVIQHDNTKVYSSHFAAIMNDSTFSKNSLTRKIAVLNTEFDAWNKGMTLAIEKRIPIDKRKFELVKTKCLNTYVKWVADMN